MPVNAKARVAPPRFPKTDKRLLGTWKSDKRRTFAEWNWKKGATPKKKAKLKSFFGKLEVTYTRTKVISLLRHKKWEQERRYAVLGLDEKSVAIIEFGELEIKNRRKYWNEGLKIIKEFCSQPEIKHIHFDKNHFWVSLGNGRNREFFRKTRSSN
jgi:hypothetical protein